MSSISGGFHTNGVSRTDGLTPPEDRSLPEALGSALFGRNRQLKSVLAGNTILRRGSQGAGLRKVQQALVALGHDLPKHGADGRWHHETRDAVVALQTANGLDGSGVVDQETVALLDGLLQAREGGVDVSGGDGSISLADLRAAEKTMGRDALIRALGQDPTKIEFDAVSYLQGDVGSMDGQVDRYQKVLTGHLAGAKLLDANFDGAFDENDLIFTQDAAGKVNVETIGKALRDRVLIGSSMVDAAYDLAGAKHRFGDLEFNPFCFEAEDEDDDSGMGVMVLNPGVEASVALKDIFDNPDMYRFECATALTIIRYKAILDLIGPKDFDQLCGDLRIGPWESTDEVTAAWEISGRANGGADVAADEAGKAEVKPGEYTYFKNWDVSKAGFEGGWQGENVVSLGDGLYYGHPFGVIAGDEIVEHLNDHRKSGSRNSASLLDLRARIGASILDYDVTPE